MAEPYCLAMVLCDDVHRDPATNKWTILGTFSQFLAPQYPATIQFVVYFAITDGLGETKIRIRLVDSEEVFSDKPQEVMSAEAPLSFEDPLAVIEGALGVRVPLPHSGVYHCELYAGENLLMSRRLLVVDPQVED